MDDLGRFAAEFTHFVHAMALAAERPENPVAARIREHLGVDPTMLPTTAAEVPETDHPNLQLGLEDVLRGAELIGYRARHLGYVGAGGLSEIVAGEAILGPISLGPVQYADVEVGDGRVVRCVATGIYLGRWEDEPLVVAVSQARDRPFGGSALKLELLAAGEETASAALRAIRAAMREHNVFRGRIISLQPRPDHRVEVRFHDPPGVERSGVILPDGTLERLERHALGVAAGAEALLAAGRHLKRGILLHGPPGTGKTLSVGYLIGAMQPRTTIVLTGRGLELIEQAVGIARDLAPATVVFEDVDLVAAERTMPVGHHGVLLELLNEMEGLAEDADLLFLLTTNRPDLIEPALAARPGRVDLALEIPLPDRDGRRRLFELYSAGVDLDEAFVDDAVERTAGLTGAFIRELMRQAAVTAALDGGAPPGPAEVRTALDELLADRSALTRRLLGQPSDGPPAAPPYPAMLHALGAAGVAVPPELQDE